MDVLHINTASHVGGAAKVSLRLMQAQRFAGIKAKMMVGMKQRDTPGVCAFETKADPFLMDRFRRRGLLYYEYRGSHELINHSQVVESDLLHFHNLHGGFFNPFSLALLTTSKPSVWTLHDMHAFTGHCAHSFDCNKWLTGCGGCRYLSWYPAIHDDKSALLWKDKKWIYEKSNLCVVTPSRWLEEKVRKSILKEHPVHLIYNGVDASLFRPRNKKETRRELGLPEEAFIFGTAANGGIFDNPYKGGKYAHEVVRAFNGAATDSVFLNIGCGRKSNQPQTIDLPWVDDEDVFAKILSSLDVFLFTSIAENCPLAVLEALSCGIPVAAFSVGGVPELVRDGEDGILVKRGEWQSIASGMRQLWKDRSLIRRMGGNARERVLKEFDHRIIERQYANLYTERIEEWHRNNNVNDCWDDCPEIVLSKPYQRYFSRLRQIVRDRNDSWPEKRRVAAHTKNKGEETPFRSHYDSKHGSDTDKGLSINEKWPNGPLNRAEMSVTEYSEAAINHLKAGALHLKNGNQKRALFHYQSSVELEPNNSSLQKLLADFYYGVMGEIEASVEHYGKAVINNPNDVGSLLMLGHISVTRERFDAAQIFYGKVHEIDPENRDANKMLRLIIELRQRGAKEEEVSRISGEGARCGASTASVNNWRNLAINSHPC